MFRTASVVLGLAFLATATNAAEIKVSTLDKSPAQLRAAVSDAAFKACKQAYSGDALAMYEREACARDAAEAALLKSTASTNAQNTVRDGAVLASR